MCLKRGIIPKGDFCIRELFPGCGMQMMEAMQKNGRVAGESVGKY